MSPDLDPGEISSRRGYGLAMLLLSIPVAVLAVTLGLTAVGWWSYATAIVAASGAALLVARGIVATRPPKAGR
ncbi:MULTISPECIES: hypothetical protein [Arthrobacter]|uniref:Uncharacterized protein n=2 Tax=Arthrobacter TaxID=1663 RepID=A0ABU9KG42_9MICC|nr:hypothetical protein [Arthrobacter sp. YJM1]MDP5225846.1 hypothetical protein [Arthrobacter sp. YJM1]